MSVCDCIHLHANCIGQSSQLCHCMRVIIHVQARSPKASRGTSWKHGSSPSTRAADPSQPPRKCRPHDSAETSSWGRGSSESLHPQANPSCGSASPWPLPYTCLPPSIWPLLWGKASEGPWEWPLFYPCLRPSWSLQHCWPELSVSWTADWPWIASVQ